MLEGKEMEIMLFVLTDLKIKPLEGIQAKIYTTQPKSLKVISSKTVVQEILQIFSFQN